MKGFKNNLILFCVMFISAFFLNPMNILAYRMSDLYVSVLLVYASLYMASNMLWTHQIVHYLQMGHFDKKTFFSLNINFFSKILCREIKVDGNNFSLKANLLKNKIVIVKNKDLTIKKFSKTSINDTYKSQLQEIFSKKISKICTLKQALQIMKLVEKVRQNRK